MNHCGKKDEINFYKSLQGKQKQNLQNFSLFSYNKNLSIQNLLVYSNGDSSMATFGLESFSFNMDGDGGKVYLHCRVRRKFVQKLDFFIDIKNSKFA